MKNVRFSGTIFMKNSLSHRIIRRLLDRVILAGKLYLPHHMFLHQTRGKFDTNELVPPIYRYRNDIDCV